MKPDGFDKIASIYDRLARLVFGDAIQKAQEYFLNDIFSESRILILGGGTGALLAKLLELKPACEVWYIEASGKMLELSKEKTNHSDRVHFIQGTENSIPSEIRFDVVITNFYLDLFTEEVLDSVLEKIQNVCKPEALWFVTDFIDRKKWWQFVLLKIMYSFFRITCSVEVTRLPNWNQSLLRRNLIKKKSEFFFEKFIEATVYHRI
ncbi:MAG: class I SAM-dependent methyltransferase [Chryseolinea sp.]